MEDKNIRERKVPQMGANEEYAEVCKWEVEEGENVKEGEVVLVMETTKATFEVESKHEGYIYFLYEVGEEAGIGDVVAVISNVKEEGISDKYKKKKEEGVSDYGDLRLTAPAREYLDSIEADYSQLPTDRILRKEDVRDLLGHEDERDDEVEETDTPGVSQQRVAIVGAGKGGLTLLEAIRLVAGFHPVGFLETDQEKIGTDHGGLPVWKEDFPNLKEERGVGSIAIELADRKRRLDIVRRAQKHGIRSINVVHQEAWVSPSVKMGMGNFVKAGAVVETESEIGDACIVDNGVEVPHHCTMHSGVHLAPGVTMGGRVEIGGCKLVGVGVTLAPSVEIGKNVIISPGSTVMEDLPSDVIVEGNPAEVIGSRN